MTSSAERVREAVATCHRAAAAARIARWRDPDDDAPPADREAAAWLASDAAREALAEGLDTGELDAEQHAWLDRHVAWLARERTCAAARRRLRAALGAATLPGGEPLRLASELGALALSDDPVHRAETGRALASALASPARAFVDAHLVADRPPGRKPALDFGGIYAVPAVAPSEAASDDLTTVASAFLRATEDAAEDSVRWHARGLGAGTPVPWQDWVRALRARELDAPSRARERFRHAAGAFRRLGFEDDMNARMRAEVDRAGALPFASVACVHVPRDVRVALAPAEWGVASDVCAAAGVGRALGVALALRTLPVELRHPLGACVPGALGALASGLWADRAQLERVQRLTRAEAERVARVAGALVLLSARLWAAIAAAPVSDASTADARMEALAAAVGPALRCDLPPALAGVLVADVRNARDRAHEALAALALGAGLRERFDEDWFLNHRVEETIRGAGQRGNTLSVDAWCAELGVQLSGAAPRALQLVA